MQHVSNLALKGEPERDSSRINNTKFAKTAIPLLIYSEMNTSPIIGPPVSEEALKKLLDKIFEVCAARPDLDSEEEFGVINTPNTS